MNNPTFENPGSNTFASMERMKLIECPRDAMQGIPHFIPTKMKAGYINTLLKVGFDTLDFGSFVSPKAIPQMRDTAELLGMMDTSETKLLAIVANKRGAEDALQFERIDYLGYPFSVSETFQKRNTGTGIEASLTRVEEIQRRCLDQGKKLVVYLSMGFGNPYGEKWHPDLVTKWCERLHREFEVDILAISDTIGVSKPRTIVDLFTTLIPELPEVEMGAHLHTTPETWKEKAEAVHQSGCRRMDGALKGYGGCPMAKEELTGNMPTEKLIEYFEAEGMDLKLDHEMLQKATEMAPSIML